MTNADGVDLSNEKYRVAMALFAARMDPIDALGVYMPELHPESFRFNNSNSLLTLWDVRTLLSEFFLILRIE